MQNNRSLSLEFKIYGTLTLVFLLVLFVAVTLTAKSERHLATSIVEQQTLHTAESYFDSINVLMISGTMNQRTTLQEKMLDKPGITEARIIRSDGISKLFGKGLPGEQPMDELDKRALKGEEIIQDSELDGNTVITVVSPLIASENYRGTNCLTCHQVKEGDILGAVRISYNMQELEAQISDDILQATLVLVVLFAVSLFVTAFIFRRFVISRLKKLRNTIENIEKESDLTQRIKVFKSDEIGQVTEAFNRMLDKFQLGFQKVTESAHHVSRSSTTINENAEETARAVSEQRNGTDMMAAAINEMEATSREVKANAERTAEASDQAAASSKQGTQVTKEAIDVIGRLSEEIRSAAVVIEQLNANTQQVGSVLDVIKGIAEQTNLLALNAAIEAARAGESGRGFAVVADEVRTLATKTHESAEEIETMIHQLQSGASNAVGVMNNANESAQQSVTQIESAMSSLTEINEHVSEINTLNDLMVNISDDQSKAAEEINSTVLNISNLAENSSTHASETSQLSAELKQLADELDTLVSGFKIDG